MGFNFGAFAGGFGTGLERGQRMARAAKESKYLDLKLAEAQRRADDDASIRSAFADEAPAATGGPSHGFGVGDAGNPQNFQPEGRPAGVPIPPAATQGQAQFDRESTAGRAETAGLTGITPGTEQDGRLHPKADLDRFFYERTVPRVMRAYVKSGRFTEAKAFQDFVDSQDGRGYVRNWNRAMGRVMLGDFDGAMPAIEALYNDGYPDGKRVKVSAGEAGKGYRVDFLDADGNVTQSRNGNAEDLAKLGVMAIAPNRRAELMMRQQADNAKLDRDWKQKVYLEDRRDTRDATREDRRDERQSLTEDRRDARHTSQLASLERRFTDRENGGRITPSQKSNNLEIDAARRRLAGMTADDVRRSAQQYSQTGRENPDYDPEIARLARIANQRKVGDDPDFDSFSQRQPARSASGDVAKMKAMGDVAKKFSADPAMRGHRLGKMTHRGVEVFDQSGRQVGYYN